MRLPRCTTTPNQQQFCAHAIHHQKTDDRSQITDHRRQTTENRAPDSSRRGVTSGFAITTTRRRGRQGPDIGTVGPKPNAPAERDDTSILKKSRNASNAMLVIVPQAANLQSHTLSALPHAPNPATCNPYYVTRNPQPATRTTPPPARDVPPAAPRSPAPREARD